MVTLKDVRASNSSLKASSNPSRTALFVGATAGIGQATLFQFAEHVAKPKVYFVGRNSEAATKLKEQLNKINAAGEYIYLKAEDLSLLRNVDKVCEELKGQESCLDLLFLSPGWLSFGGLEATPEGLDALLSIRYHARMRFVCNLLPLLTASPHAYVVSVLAAGHEGKVVESDLSLKEKKNYSALTCANASSTLNTLFMEQIAKENPTVTFVHEYPGFVKSNLMKNGRFSPVTHFLINWVFMPLATPFCISPTEAGERGLYNGTSEHFKPGFYGVGWNNEPAASKKPLAQYREQGIDKKIFSHTLQEFDRIAAL